MKKHISGQGLVEYALLLALLAAAVFLALQMAGITLEQTYCNIASSFGNSQACQDSAYCADDFSAGAGSWGTNTGAPPPGNWNFNDGKLCGSSSGTIYSACSQNLQASDYTINLNSANLLAGDGYGVYFRSTIVNGQVNGYTFQYDPGLKAMVFRKWVDGRELSPFAVYRVPSGYDWYGEDHDVQVKTDGDTFTAYIDGVPVLSAQDSTYPEGGAGLRTWDSTTFCLDDFSITPNLP